MRFTFLPLLIWILLVSIASAYPLESDTIVPEFVQTTDEDCFDVEKGAKVPVAGKIESTDQDPPLAATAEAGEAAPFAGLYCPSTPCFSIAKDAKAPFAGKFAVNIPGSGYEVHNVNVGDVAPLPGLYCPTNCFNVQQGAKAPVAGKIRINIPGKGWEVHAAKAGETAPLPGLYCPSTPCSMVTKGFKAPLPGEFTVKLVPPVGSGYEMHTADVGEDMSDVGAALYCPSTACKCRRFYGSKRCRGRKKNWCYLTKASAKTCLDKTKSAYHGWWSKTPCQQK